MIRVPHDRTPVSTELARLLSLAWLAIFTLLAPLLISGVPGPGPEVAPAPGIAAAVRRAAQAYRAPSPEPTVNLSCDVSLRGVYWARSCRQDENGRLARTSP